VKEIHQLNLQPFHLLTFWSAGEYCSGATSIEQVKEIHQLNFQPVHLLTSRQLVNFASV